MDSFGSRISLFIESKDGLTRADFAKAIGISQAYVSQMCSGVRIPSDRTVSDICRIFHVNEHWLRTGEGEMLEKLDEDQELVEFMTGLLNDCPDSFRRRFISVVSKLDNNGWAVLEQIANELANNKTDP